MMDRITISELAYIAGTRTQVIREMIRYDLLQPQETADELVFAAQVVPQVRQMLRLHVQLDVSWSSMPLVMELLARIERLEAELGQRS